jgi:hypothetical protein
MFGMVRPPILVLAALLAVLLCADFRARQASAGAADTDRDSIPNSKEEEPAYRRAGGSSGHMDVWLECDGMQGRQPDPEVARNLQQVFKAAPVGNPDGTKGIRLHVNIDDSFRYEERWGDATKEGGRRTLFQKAMQRRSASMDGDPAYTHYCLFVNSVDPKGTILGQSFDSTDSSHSGLGDTVVVALGRLSPKGGTAWQQTGVLMRTLGFNLGLEAGGGDGVNYKPNYLSVMNLDHQYSFSTGRGTRGGYEQAVYIQKWDYSRYTGPALNERKLNEQAGVRIRGVSDRYVGFYACGTDLFYFKYNVPVDWNCDGKIRNGVRADINGDGGFTILEIQDDWRNLVYDGGVIGDS